MTPLIEVSMDGTMAWGQWLDQCCTDLSYITGDDTLPLPAMMNACKYQHVFRKENGRWKMLNFTWNAWASMDYIYADPRKWHGWVAQRSTEWPMPFEKYKLIEQYKV